MQASPAHGDKRGHGTIDDQCGRSWWGHAWGQCTVNSYDYNWMKGQ